MFKRIMDRLSGKNADQATATASAPDEQELITVYDAYGREMRITRADWRDRLFLPQLQSSWDQPDALYSLIVNGINDGMVEEVKPASARLLTIDPIPERSGTVRAIVLLKLGHLDDAEAVLRETMQKVGDTGTLLTNLAKVHAARGEHERAEATLWTAIEREPNLDNGLMWWAAMHKERGGDEAYAAALQRVAALLGSWRAQLWLARRHLERGEVDDARALYEQWLASETLDGDALMMVSGDLGNHGQVPLMIELIAPALDLQRHDPRAAMNVVQAYLQLGRVEEGEALLSRLYALNLPPFKQHLDRYAAQFQQLRTQEAKPTPIVEQAMDVAGVPYSGPIWTYGLRDPQWLFRPKPQDAKKVLFLCLAKKLTGGEVAQQERENAIGRLSRALPLYFAESVHGWTDAEGQAVIPVVRGGGPVLFGASEDEDETIAAFKSHGDIVVCGTIDDSDGRWRIACSAWSAEKNDWIARERVDVPVAELAQGVLALEQRLLAAIGGTRDTPWDDGYTRPTPEAMDVYLTGLSQSLMLSLVSHGLVPKENLWGERNMLEWWLRMALQWPSWAVPRMAYLAALSNAARYASPVLEEFRERTLALLKSIKDEQPMLARLAPLAWHCFGMNDALDDVRRHAADDEAYTQWLDRVARGGQRSVDA
ncbi:Tetratricopeptide repeat-containing protein [Dyella jiangningensis]|uniref:tetratricopeptide repeat protein n=1 Tax=Dyella sp. AtDHG13 TaxID=1938897 RepID=UPI00088B75F5|nr:tetratricopeptide repeat protein [Dyella sp. AtDHG13]PXV58984.1 tetratricopeptide repeat protein [Dyella sp. AtDHG13]SDL30853.1 Tetratricopeptide repeat-containing protein [Dyella jiangningensis]